MNRLLLVCLMSVFFFSCGSSSNNQRPPAQYEEKKSSLEEIERGSPLKFLKVTASHHGNLINQTVVEGEIVNKATLVSYKDIELLISFKDKDGSQIEKQKHTIDELIKPNSSQDFKIKTGHISGATSVSVDITGAVADK